MRSLNALVFLLGSIPGVFADVKFTVPAAGGSIPGGTAFTVTWADSGTAPSIADLTTYQLFLFTGTNAAPQQILNLKGPIAFTAGNSASVTVPITTGASTANAYFLGMISTAAAGGTVTNYSNRFTLTGMTGAFDAALIAALKGISTTGPPTVNNVVGAGAAPGVPATGAAGDFGVSYQLQEGTMRYAPMQPVPGTKITATNTDRIYPTSAVTFAKTFLPIGTIVSTMTKPQTFSVASHANTAAPASQPTDDMSRFLNRWKD